MDRIRAARSFAMRRSGHVLGRYWSRCAHKWDDRLIDKFYHLAHYQRVNKTLLNHDE